MSGHAVLVIEDESDLAHLLKLHLAELCDEVEIAANGADGLRAALRRRWALIILDLNLPGIDGIEICRRLRRNARYTPVLMLTANNSENDRVRGLEVGADDYVTKPFSLQELMARVRAIFRRCAALAARPADQADAELLSYDGLTLDCARRQLWSDGYPVTLTAKEFDLLRHFVAHPGRVYSRSQLLDQVWGLGHDGYEHTVNSHINRLRAKIEATPATPRYIVTVWGVGYRLG